MELHIQHIFLPDVVPIACENGTDTDREHIYCVCLSAFTVTKMATARNFEVIFDKLNTGIMLIWVINSSQKQTEVVVVVTVVVTIAAVVVVVTVVLVVAVVVVVVAVLVVVVVVVVNENIRNFLSCSFLRKI